MKRFFKGLGLTLVVALLAVNLAACGLSDQEKEIVGKYKLIEISITELPNIKVDTYEYFTLEFKSSRKKCIMSNKVGIRSYHDPKAKWCVNSEGKVEVTAKLGSVKSTEVYTYSDGVLSGTNITVFDGQSITMTAKFQKIT